MGVEVKKGPVLALIFLVMILHTSTNTCRAAATSVTKKSNSSSSGGGCKRRLEECLIGDMDLDEELFIMDSEISRRMLYNFGKVTDGTKDPTHQAVPCARGEPYRSCLPERNPDPSPKEHCSRYKRSC